MNRGQKIFKTIILIIFVSIFTFTLIGYSQGAEKKIEYPIKSINAISPWSAGGSSDTAFRGYINYISKELGVDINVTNVTGGNGSIGWVEALSKPADGYNLCLLTFDILTTQAQKLAPISYKNFDIINMFTNHPSILVVHGDSPWETLDDFLVATKQAKEKGENLEIGVAGENGLWHQAGLVMEEATQIEGAYKYIPYSGSSTQLAGMLGKHVDAIITSITASQQHIDSGTLRLLAVMGNERIEGFNVPTFRELGYDVVYESWRVLAAPKGIPEPALNKLREVGKKVFYSSEFQEWAKESNISPIYNDYKKTLEFMEYQYPKVEDIMKKFNLL